MALNPEGYQLVTMSAMSDSILKEFDTLPSDQYCGGQFRRRRFSQYRMSHVGDEWVLTRLPHRAYFQPTRFNNVTGGMLREFAPLRIDPDDVVLAGANAIPLDRGADWQVDVHQWRVVTDDHVRGVSVPEGPHQDGHTYSMIAVVDRHNITGGETQLIPMDSDELLFGTALRPLQAIVLDDRIMRHNATDIVAPPGTSGRRDLFLVAYNLWADRRYGDEYEAAVLSGPAEG